jgi:hypothetical protein
MGMAIGSSSSPLLTQSTTVNPWHQRQQNMNALKSALQSGDLSAAQSAFAAITANNPNVNPNGPLGQIGQALQSGNISAAQQVASSWKSSHASSAAQSQSYANQPNSQDSPSAFLSALVNSFNQAGINLSNIGTLAQSQTSALSSTTSATSLNQTTTTATNNGSGSTPSANNSPSVQDVEAFLQNLLTALQSQSATSAGSTTPVANSSASGTTSTQVAATSNTASTTTGATSTSTTASTSANPSSGNVHLGGGHHHHYSEGSNTQLSSNLQNLISQLTANTSTDLTAGASDTSGTSSVATAASTASSTPLSQLQQSFNQLTANANSSSSNSLTAFLQNFSQNLQFMSTSGSLLNTQA